MREQNKKRNHKEREEGVETIESFPLVAKIEVTTRCNLACSMCAMTFAHEQREDLSFERFMKLEPVFPYLLSAYLYGIGEPLLHPRIMDMFSVLRGHGVNVGIITNGLLMTRDMIDVWLEKGLYKLSVSIDGASAKTYNLIRRGGSFDRLMENIVYFSQQKRKHSLAQPALTFNFVAMRSNIHDLIPLIELATQYDVAEVIVSDLIVFHDSMREEALSYGEQVLTDVYSAAGTVAQKHGIRLVLPHVYETWKKEKRGHTCFPTSQSEEQEHRCDPFSFESFKPCTEPWSGFWFSHTGDIRPCCYWSKKMGNIDESPFTAIWNNERYQELRRIINTSLRPQQCRKCPIP